jgi:hypothetical protein
MESYHNVWHKYFSLLYLTVQEHIIWNSSDKTITQKKLITILFNLVYFLSLVGLWQNHVIDLPLNGLMSRYTTPFYILHFYILRRHFAKRVVNKYGSVCHCYRSFFCGTLHMWARIDEEHNYKDKMFTFQTWNK